jgi:hypothetical protein
MNEFVTKEDLKEFGLLLIDKIQAAFKDEHFGLKETLEPEWIRSKSVRKLLDISAGSVQNLRTSQKVRFKKVLGSYYYNKEDLQKLFDDDKK